MVAQEKLDSNAIRQLAFEAKFDLCGFARVEPIPEHFLSRWLAAGYDADMDWLGARLAERLDVCQLLPTARTVVSLACNYYWDDAASPVARYARGRDYHGTMKDRLRTLRRHFRTSFPGKEDYGTIDHGPSMEKVWASRAGLGYVGKSGCFITPQYGSWVVLACWILDAEVTEYAVGPTEDRCGKCNLCIAACPTGAIVEDAVVDSRKCISYLTIEKTEPLEHSFRTALSGNVFGCDICQEVCPLNDAPIRASDRFIPRALVEKTPMDFAGMSKEEYHAWVPGTPLARAQYDGLRRNAIYVLGTERNAVAVPVLERLTQDLSPMVAEAARWALEQFGSA